MATDTLNPYTVLHLGDEQVGIHQESGIDIDLIRR
jgi:hypothetical protein